MFYVILILIFLGKIWFGIVVLFVYSSQFYIYVILPLIESVTTNLIGSVYLP